MRDVLIAVIIVCSILALCAWVPSIPTEYAPGSVIQRPDWPRGLPQVLNSRDRVYGYWTNYSEDHIFYSGDMDEFRAFVGDLTRLDGAHVAVTVHDSPGSTTAVGGDRRIPFDWEIVVGRNPEGQASGTDIRIHLWRGRRIPLSDTAGSGVLLTGAGKAQ